MIEELKLISDEKIYHRITDAGLVQVAILAITELTQRHKGWVRIAMKHGKRRP
jgi:hypothetical protein